MKLRSIIKLNCIALGAGILAACAESEEPANVDAAYFGERCAEDSTTDNCIQSCAVVYDTREERNACTQAATGEQQ